MYLLVKRGYSSLLSCIMDDTIMDGNNEEYPLVTSRFIHRVRCALQRDVVVHIASNHQMQDLPLMFLGYQFNEPSFSNRAILNVRCHMAECTVQA